HQALAHPATLPQELTIGGMPSGRLRLEMNISGATLYAIGFKKHGSAKNRCWVVLLPLRRCCWPTTLDFC
ncbi:MAG: hypothetical protein ACK8QZ_04560, partial [Anaerolineales bacterium]